MKYLTQSQIKMKYEALNTDKKVVTLVTALEIKNVQPEVDKEVCIAMAMGYKLSISGSGYFEKINN